MMIGCSGVETDFIDYFYHEPTLTSTNFLFELFDSQYRFGGLTERQFGFFFRGDAKARRVNIPSVKSQVPHLPNVIIALEKV